MKSLDDEVRAVQELDTVKPAVFNTLASDG